MTNVFVDSKFVKDKLDQPGWVLVDFRVAEDYTKGHIPGAVPLPGWVSKIYVEDTKRQATVLTHLEQTFSEMGIGNDSHVIVYGDPASAHWYGVIFWVLEAFGCNSSLLKCTVQFYDGGIDRWKADGGTLEQNQSIVEPATFKATPGAKRGAKADEMLRIIEGKEEAFILDTRTADEYDGIDVRSLRGGHIPGSVNIDFVKNLNPATLKMLPLEQLQDLYQDVPQDRRVIIYCQTGARAAYTYLVLRALGHQDVAIYHDGWRVYGSDLKLPVDDETWFDFTKVSKLMMAVDKLQENK